MTNKYYANLKLLFKSRASRLLNWLGLEKRKRPLDLTSLDIHPLTAIHRADRQDVLIKAPLSKCLHFGVRALPCTSQSSSPFIQTLLDYHCGKNKAYKDSALEKYYYSMASDI